MKKFKLFLILFITFIFPINALASTETYDRETLDNYGVNKKWEITDKNKQNVLKSKKVDASEKIYDFADILTDEEEKELYDKMKQFIEKYNTDLVILTDVLPYTYDKQNEDYAADFYDYNDFGIDFEKYNGILLFRNDYEKDRYYDIYLFGEAQLYFNQYRKDELLDGIYYNLKNKYYLEGFNQFINYCDKYYHYGIPNDLKNYNVDDNGYLHYEKPPYDISLYIGFIIFTDFIIVLISMLILVKKNKMVKAKLNTMQFMNSSSLNFTSKSDTFVRSFVTSHTRDTESSHRSSSGGGHYHSSHGSSGGGHSSGGGRHG